MRSTFEGWVLVGLLGGCPGPGDGSTCQELCRMLMVDCGMGAYPDPGSCQQGCLYEDEAGGDIRSLQGCVSEAGCDTALVLECSRTFGAVP